MGGSIDPIAYDVAELRQLARVRGDRYVDDGFLWLERPESYPAAGETVDYDRPVTWSGSLEERQKPYLRRLPEGDRGRRVVREWVQMLVDRAGADAAVEAFAYYESLGWVTEAVRAELEGYLLAVGYRSGGSLGDLTRADHVESLARTVRLAQLVDPDGAEKGTEPVEGDREGQENERAGEGAGNAGPSTGGLAGRAGGKEAEEEEGEGEGEGTPTSPGDRWLDAVVSDVRPPPDPDAEETEGASDDAEDAGFEFGSRTE